MGEKQEGPSQGLIMEWCEKGRDGPGPSLSQLPSLRLQKRTGSPSGPGIGPRASGIRIQESMGENTPHPQGEGRSNEFLS